MSVFCRQKFTEAVLIRQVTGSSGCDQSSLIREEQTDANPSAHYNVSHYANFMQMRALPVEISLIYFYFLNKYIIVLCLLTNFNNFKHILCQFYLLIYLILLFQYYLIEFYANFMQISFQKC